MEQAERLEGLADFYEDDSKIAKLAREVAGKLRDGKEITAATRTKVTALLDEIDPASTAHRIFSNAL